MTRPCRAPHTLQACTSSTSSAGTPEARDEPAEHRVGGGQRRPARPRPREHEHTRASGLELDELAVRENVHAPILAHRSDDARLATNPAPHIPTPACRAA